MWQCHEGINRLYLQAAYKRVSLERKVANRVLLSDGLATRDDELAEESGGRGTSSDERAAGRCSQSNRAFLQQKAKGADR